MARRPDIVSTALFLLAAISMPAAAQTHGGMHGQSFDTARARVAPNAFADDEGGRQVARDMRLFAGIALGAGYDSNLDQRFVARDAGSFGFVDAGAALVIGDKLRHTTVIGRGSFASHDIDERPHRWDAGALVDHFETWSPGVVFNAGAFYLHDEVDINKADIASGYYQLTRSDERSEAFLRGRTLRVDYLTPIGAGVGGQVFSADRSFSYNRIEQSGGLLVRRNERIAPFVEAGVAMNDYYDQVNEAVLDRDATEGWVVGGLRFKLSEQWRLDAGARHHRRWLDDPVIKEHDATFVDAKLVWTPYDGQYVEFNVDRTLVEPYSDDARVTERTTYSVYVSSKVDARTRLTIDAGYADAEQIGSVDRFKEVFADAKIAYRLSQLLEVFAVAHVSHIENTATGEEADRFRLGGGLKIGD